MHDEWSETHDGAIHVLPLEAVPLVLRRTRRVCRILAWKTLTKRRACWAIITTTVSRSSTKPSNRRDTTVPDGDERADVANLSRCSPSYS